MMEVVILAGGIGRRFGGTKQFTPVTADGKSLLEITLENCLRAGCRRAILVTAPALEADLKDLISARSVPGMEIVIALQRAEDLPVEGIKPRQRPWGTAHALWAARHAVTENFLLFNADDSYGPNAPAVLAATLDSEQVQTRFGLLGYTLGSTLSADGTVSRAVCQTNDHNLLTGLVEHPVIDSAGRVLHDQGDFSQLPLDALVSMNAWAFTGEVFPLLENHLNHFLATADLAEDECYLPAAIDSAVQKGLAEVLVATAPDQWCGMTWPQDRERVARQLADQAAVLRMARAFGLNPEQAVITPFGNGLIHSTWKLESADTAHVVQRINHRVFADPVAMAENADLVARRLDDALSKESDSDPRHRLVYLHDKDERPWSRDDDGTVWRVSRLIADSRCPDPACIQEVRSAARALGRFPGLVTAGEGPEPRKILPGFHDTAARLKTFRDAAATDELQRRSACRPEVERLLELSELACRLTLRSLPLRPVHNDAKLDNVLVDAETGQALCVLDLDTTMLGLAAHDFGDLVRSSVTGKPEDEPDLDSVLVDEKIFTNITAGYLEGAASWLDAEEKSSLVDGALAITYEQALRFLSDHLTGDKYYSIDEAGHNLRRARTQLRLLDELLAVEMILKLVVAQPE